VFAVVVVLGNKWTEYHHPVIVLVLGLGLQENDMLGGEL
jgi:hypothetical protein